ncbi:hypothetical protein EPN44_04980 [bacterium]|nr:MAG: hypothetical protein EPN44_04980 [bacterium]
MIAISSQARMFDALASARRIDAAVYLPAPDFTRALAAAARRGAAVTLHVPGTMPEGSQRARGLEARVRELRAAGVQVTEERERIEHLKAVVVDGREAYLADRNFARDETLVRTDEAGAVEAAIAGAPAASDDLVLAGKAGAQELETQLVRAAPAGSEVFVVSEYANYSPLVRELLARAGELHERVIVGIGGVGKPLEHKALEALAAHGVDVEIARIAEKGVCVGDCAVVTSANATVGQPSMSEWAARFDGAQAQAVRAHLIAAVAKGSARKLDQMLE